jgi:polyketide biosynthesis enoyl-CoA hydratase PksH
MGAGMSNDHFDHPDSIRYENVRVRVEEGICHLQLYRPKHNNTINSALVEDCIHAVTTHAAGCRVLVLHGLPEVFCFGADFSQIRPGMAAGKTRAPQPERMYDLWLQLAQGPFVSVAAVSGKVNAGGVGFVAACDIVLADESASFSLSELLFGLFPACVLPFLVRRIGTTKANYLTLTTQALGAKEAQSWGLVDRCEPALTPLLHRHLLRLRRLSPAAVARYKAYMQSLSNALDAARPTALAANHTIFSDPANLAAITRYVDTGKFPWETA